MTQDRDDDIESRARGLVQQLFWLLERSHNLYVTVYRLIEMENPLDPPTREASIGALAEVATVLRRTAPDLAVTDVLPQEERPDLILLAIRILTDSISIALADKPEGPLMVHPDVISELFNELTAWKGQPKTDASE